MATVSQPLIMAAQLQFPAKKHSGTFVALDKSGDLDKLLVSPGVFYGASPVFVLLPSFVFSVRWMLAWVGGWGDNNQAITNTG